MGDTAMVAYNACSGLVKASENLPDAVLSDTGVPVPKPPDPDGLAGLLGHLMSSALSRRLAAMRGCSAAA
jgi:hypothetical protein